MATHGFEVERLGSVPSTQDLLAARARAGEDVTGICLRATEQTKGRGRRGTAWTSPPGGSYQSVGLGREAWPWLTLALGAGVAGSLGETCGVEVTVKWPNDLFLAGRKLGGMITEVVAGQVIAGVGVNVRNAAPEGGATLDRDDVDAVSDAVLVGLERGLALALAGGEAVREAFAAVDVLRGLRVTVVAAQDREVTGVAAGVDARGALLLEVDGGEVLSLTAGHVTAFGPEA